MIHNTILFPLLSLRYGGEFGFHLPFYPRVSFASGKAPGRGLYYKNKGLLEVLGLDPTRTYKPTLSSHKPTPSTNSELPTIHHET